MTSSGFALAGSEDGGQQDVLAAPVLLVKAIEDGWKLQVAFVGRVPQESWTVTLKPGAEEIPTVSVMVPEAGTVIEVFFGSTESNRTGGEADSVKFGSPLY